MTTNKKSKVKRANSSTGYRGVTKTTDGKYVAQINYKLDKPVDGKTRKTERIGRFGKAVDAARAYDTRAGEIYGDKAKLNFPAK